MKVGLYLHLPFCVSRCTYCDFNAYAGLGQDLVERYLESLCEDIRRTGAERRYQIETVFFGGGTPSLYEAPAIERILRSCREAFDYRPGEVTLEGNPGTLSLAKLRGYREAGINRLSLGVQTFRSGLLERLNRIHSPQEVEDAVGWARQAGFANLSLDLIYGLPGQTLRDWKLSLERALALGPDHLSVYQLIVEPSTHLEAQLRRGEIELPPEARTLAMDRWLRLRLRAAGWGRYEISNWCRPGFHSRHNRIYWQDRPYLGLGCGATGFIDGWRQRRLLHPSAYCKAIEQGRSPVFSAERMGHESAIKDTLMMALRTCWGVDLRQLRRRYPRVRPEGLRRAFELLPAEWIERKGPRLRLTPKGADFASSVQHHLMDCYLSG